MGFALAVRGSRPPPRFVHPDPVGSCHRAIKRICAPLRREFNVTSYYIHYCNVIIIKLSHCIPVAGGLWIVALWIVALWISASQRSALHCIALGLLYIPKPNV